MKLPTRTAPHQVARQSASGSERARQIPTTASSVTSRGEERHVVRHERTAVEAGAGERVEGGAQVLVEELGVDAVGCPRGAHGAAGERVRRTPEAVEERRKRHEEAGDAGGDDAALAPGGAPAEDEQRQGDDRRHEAGRLVAVPAGGEQGAGEHRRPPAPAGEHHDGKGQRPRRGRPHVAHRQPLEVQLERQTEHRGGGQRAERAGEPEGGGHQGDGLRGAEQGGDQAGRPDVAPEQRVAEAEQPEVRDRQRVRPERPQRRAVGVLGDAGGKEPGLVAVDHRRNLAPVQHAWQHHHAAGKQEGDPVSRHARRRYDARSGPVKRWQHMVVGRPCRR